jgi:ABC-2 type transport system ATP-binding protein
MITAENVSVYFYKGFLKKKIVALDNFNLEIKKGDFVGLVGQNGAGKSTAMYCLLGLINPKSGKILIDGFPPVPGSGIYNNISYLPEEPHYHDFLTIGEALSFYNSLYNNPSPKKKLEKLLEDFGLKGFEDLVIKKCSKGMKQKLGIAQCLASEAGIYFLDEPTRGLDPIVTRFLKQKLVELSKKGCTIIMNSHVLSEVETLANRVAIIEKGKVILQDTVKNLTGAHTNKYYVELEKIPGLPSYFKRIDKNSSALCGEIPEKNLYQFMLFLKKKKSRLYVCSLNKATLEDSFYNIIKGA